MPGRFFHAPGIDLVNLGDIRAFMLTQDLLYNQFVPASAKHYSLNRHYRQIREAGHQKSVASKELLATTTDPAFGIFLVLQHLLEQGLDLSFLDVGSFVGDVGLRYANYFRTIGCGAKVHCFDPTLSGELVPYNIEINGLEGRVFHHPLAISGIDGYVTFREMSGYTDSSYVMEPSRGIPNSIVPAMRLSKFIQEQNIQHAFIKLDTENQESVIIPDILPFLIRSQSAMVFEFHAEDEWVPRLLDELAGTHLLLDVGYVPKPFVFQTISSAYTNLGSLRTAVASRPYKFTDVLAISSKTPNFSALMERLASLKSKPVEYSMVYDG